MIIYARSGQKVTKSASRRKHAATRTHGDVGGSLASALHLGAASGAAPTVVLNEVAWGGTAAGGQDEWIELRNCTGAAVDLAGWVLTIGESRIPLSVAEESTVEVRRSTLEPNGYLLLERTDDTTVSDVVADIIYKGSLVNSGADLTLVDAVGNVIDRVVATGTGWPAGCGSEGDLPYATMERVDPAVLGDVWRRTTDRDLRTGRRRGFRSPAPSRGVRPRSAT
jgi:hypothetical protein